MKTIRKPKIGLTGTMAPTFRGDKEGNFAKTQATLERMAEQLGFELKVVSKGIYSVEDAQASANELKDWGADFILIQTSSFAGGGFIYPFAETEIRLGLWSVPEGAPTSEGGLPLNSFTAVNMYNSIIKTRLPDYPHGVKWFHGDPGQPLFDERLAVTVSALRALVNLQEATIGLIGGVAEGFDDVIIDADELRRRLGIGVVELDLDEILQRAEKVSEQDAVKASEAIVAGNVRLDPKEAGALLKSGRVDLAFKQLAAEQDFDAVAVSCWPRFQDDYRFAVCAVMGQMNTEGLIASCEGDIASAVGMLALRYMTGGQVITLMDLATIDPEDESILLWHCGPTSPALADENGVEMTSLWLFHGYEENGLGLHNNLVLKPGEVTIFGFTPDFRRSLLVSGEIDNQKPSYRGSRGWMKNLRMNEQPVGLAQLMQTIMDSGFPHHYPVGYGNYSNAAMELNTMLKLEPIQSTPYVPYLRP